MEYMSRRPISSESESSRQIGVINLKVEIVRATQYHFVME
jgi:hypothetical protein